jgi:hypothetical protein
MEYQKTEDLEKSLPKPISSEKFHDHFQFLHYLLIISSYLYIKSYETCDKTKHDCDFYYDKFTILYKLLLIAASGFINAFILFLALLKFYKRRILLVETTTLIFSYIFINWILRGGETFEYTGTLYSISMGLSFIIFVTLHMLCNLSIVLVRCYVNIRKLLLIDFIIKLKLFIFTNVTGGRAYTFVEFN